MGFCFTFAVSNLIIKTLEIMGANSKTKKSVNVVLPLTIIERINDSMNYQKYPTIEGSNRKLDQKGCILL